MGGHRVLVGAGDRHRALQRGMAGKEDEQPELAIIEDLVVCSKKWFAHGMSKPLFVVSYCRQAINGVPKVVCSCGRDTPPPP